MRQQVKDYILSLKGVDTNLVLSIAEHESGLNPYVTRYEEKWTYFYKPDLLSNNLGITLATEKIHQATSWGPMQIMGTVARELGYNSYLQTLGVYYIPAIDFGVKKILTLQNKYSDMKDVISSYNQGSPIKDLKGQYKNQDYIDDVLKRYRNR